MSQRFRLLLCLSLFLYWTPDVYGSGIADDIVAPYKNNAHDIAENFLLTARSLFWKLAAIQFAVTSLGLVFQKGDIQQWAAHLIRQILSIGFYSYLMEHSYEFSCDIISGFRTIGQGSGRLNPQNIFSIGTAVSANILHNVSITDVALATVQGFSALIVCCGFALIAAFIIVALCEGYVLIGVGVLLTGLGGLQWTRDFAHKSFTLSFGVGIKLLTCYMLYQIGYQEMRHWTTYEFHTASQCLSIVGGTLIYLLLMLRLPQLAQQTIHGAITGSTALENLSQLTAHMDNAAGMALGGKAAISAGLQEARQGAQKDEREQSSTSQQPHGPPPSVLNRMGHSVKKPLIFASRAAWGTAKAAKTGLDSEAYGRLTGSRLRAGTPGGRIAHYIRQGPRKKDPPDTTKPND